jgi:hypothetical protein
MTSEREPPSTSHALTECSGLSPAGAHALNLLVNYSASIAVSAGASVLLIAGGLAILRGGLLPAWAGWLGLVVGVMALLPIQNLGPIPAGIWTLVVSVVLCVRAAGAPAVAGAGAARAVPSEAR